MAGALMQLVAYGAQDIYLTASGMGGLALVIKLIVLFHY